jgi:hypothetical protein
MPVITVSPTRTGDPVMAAWKSGWIWVLQRSAPVVASIPSMFGNASPSGFRPLMTPTTSVLPASDGLVRA